MWTNFGGLRDMCLYKPILKVLTLLIIGISTLTKLILNLGGDNAIYILTSGDFILLYCVGRGGYLGQSL